MKNDVKKFILYILLSTLVYCITIILGGVVLSFVRNEVSVNIYNIAELVVTALAFVLYFVSYNLVSRKHFVEDMPYVKFYKVILGYVGYASIFFILLLVTNDTILAGMGLVVLPILAFKIRRIFKMSETLRSNSKSKGLFSEFTYLLYLIVSFIPVYMVTSITFNAAKGLSTENVSTTKYGMESHFTLFIDLLFLVIVMYLIQYVNHKRLTNSKLNNNDLNNVMVEM